MPAFTDQPSTRRLIVQFLRKLLPAFLIVGTMTAADFTGTWKLNPEKSKLANRDISQGTLTIKQTAPDTYSSTLDYLTKAGQRRHEESIRICDGKPHPLPALDPSKPAAALCEVGPGSTRNVIETKSDKVVAEMTSTVSADGKTLTNVWKYEDGEVVFVFEKQ